MLWGYSRNIGDPPCIPFVYLGRNQRLWVRQPHDLNPRTIKYSCRIVGGGRAPPGGFVEQTPCGQWQHFSSARNQKQRLTWINLRDIIYSDQGKFNFKRRRFKKHETLQSAARCEIMSEGITNASGRWYNVIYASAPPMKNDGFGPAATVKCITSKFLLLFFFSFLLKIIA